MFRHQTPNISNIAYYLEYFFTVAYNEKINVALFGLFFQNFNVLVISVHN